MHLWIRRKSWRPEDPKKVWSFLKDILSLNYLLDAFFFTFKIFFSYPKLRSYYSYGEWLPRSKSNGRKQLTSTEDMTSKRIICYYRCHTKSISPNNKVPTVRSASKAFLISSWAIITWISHTRNVCQNRGLLFE